MTCNLWCSIAVVDSLVLPRHEVLLVCSISTGENTQSDLDEACGGRVRLAWNDNQIRVKLVEIIRSAGQKTKWCLHCQNTRCTCSRAPEQTWRWWDTPPHTTTVKFALLVGLSRLSCHEGYPAVVLGCVLTGSRELSLCQINASGNTGGRIWFMLT